MNTFYFTYGTDGHPYHGGWTEVAAKDLDMACNIFRLVHPDKRAGLLNCSGIYSESYFRTTTMSLEGNFGHRCWERIALSVEKMKE